MTAPEDRSAILHTYERHRARKAWSTCIAVPEEEQYSTGGEGEKGCENERSGRQSDEMDEGDFWHEDEVESKIIVVTFVGIVVKDKEDWLRWRD